jgi:hypothetical protein
MNMQIPVPTRGYPLTLLCIGACLVAIHLLLASYHQLVEELPWLLRQLFDLDEENNLPTWFSSFLLLNDAIVMYLFCVSRQQGQYLHWVILASGFLLLSVDEVAGLHETFNTAIEINWAIPGAVLVTLTGLYFLPFLARIDRRLAMHYVASGAIYVSGAVVVELLSADMDEDSLAYSFATALEEGLEMLGAWYFLAVNLAALRTAVDTREATSPPAQETPELPH